MLRRPVIFHRVDGAGEPLLLLNGIAMSVASWEPVARRLAATHRVVRCDLRGQLMTPGAPPHDVAEHAGDVAALLDALSIDRVHVLGTSFGGAVAMHLAARWPQRVRSMVLAATTDAFDDTMAAEVRRWRQACVETLAGGDRGRLVDVLDASVYSRSYVAANGEGRATRRRQVSLLPDVWFEGLIGLLDSAATVNAAPLLQQLRCPTLLIAAGEDAFIPIERMRRLAEGIGGAELRIMDGAGHALVVEQPEELARLTLEFISKG